MASEFRAYVLDDDDRIVGRHELEAKEAATTLVAARQYAAEHDVEVWQRSHIVGRIGQVSTAPAQTEAAFVSESTNAASELTAGLRTRMGSPNRRRLPVM